MVHSPLLRVIIANSDNIKQPRPPIDDKKNLHRGRTLIRKLRNCEHPRTCLLDLVLRARKKHVTCHWPSSCYWQSDAHKLPSCQFEQKDGCDSKVVGVYTAIVRLFIWSLLSALHAADGVQTDTRPNSIGWRLTLRVTYHEFQNGSEAMLCFR